MSAIEIRKVGKSKAEVTKMGLGGAPLGDLFHVLDEDQAQSVLQAAWDAGIRYYDTAPFYGYGKSEHRVGHFLRQQLQIDVDISPLAQLLDQRRLGIDVGQAVMHEMTAADVKRWARHACP